LKSLDIYESAVHTLNER